VIEEKAVDIRFLKRGIERKAERSKKMLPTCLRQIIVARSAVGTSCRIQEVIPRLLYVSFYIKMGSLYSVGFTIYSPCS
jgi:hypothetical protein